MENRIKFEDLLKFTEELAYWLSRAQDNKSAKKFFDVLCELKDAELSVFEDVMTALYNGTNGDAKGFIVGALTNGNSEGFDDITQDIINMYNVKMKDKAQIELFAASLDMIIKKAYAEPVLQTLGRYMKELEAKDIEAYRRVIRMLINVCEEKIENVLTYIAYDNCRHAKEMIDYVLDILYK